MTTRAQVRIKATGLGWEEEIQLYRHADGYPTAVLPSLARAFDMTGGGWQAGRAGIAAGFICVEGYTPGRDVSETLSLPPRVAYEPESGMNLHGDIEWLYILTLVNHSAGSLAEKPDWEVEIRVPIAGFWDDPTIEHTKFVTSGPVKDLAEMAENIEQSVYKGVGV